MSTRPAPTRWVAVRPLRHRQFALVWTAGLVSTVGTWMETVAVGDLVALDTGEAASTGLVAAAGFLPMGLLGPVGGAIADRVDRRRFLFLTTILSTVCATALAVLSGTGRASPAAVSAVVFVAGCVNGISFPAYSAMLPDLVPEEDLLGAVSLTQAEFNLGRVVGPALAGLAIALGSHTWALAINALSFGALLAALVALRLPERRHPPAEGSLWRRIREGAAAARREPAIASAIQIIAIVALTASPFIALIPAMARVRHDGGDSLTSAFVTCQGIGAVAGALLVPGLAERFGRGRVLGVAFVALPLTLLAYAAAPGPVPAALALVPVGAAYISVLSGLGAVVQLRAPAALRARVISLYFLAVGVLYPVGSLLQGPIGDRVGLGPVTAGGAVAMLVAIGLLRLLRPERLRALDVTQPEPAVSAAAEVGEPATPA